MVWYTTTRGYEGAWDNFASQAEIAKGCEGSFLLWLQVYYRTSLILNFLNEIDINSINIPHKSNHDPHVIYDKNATLPFCYSSKESK